MIDKGCDGAIVEPRLVADSPFLERLLCRDVWVEVSTVAPNKHRQLQQPLWPQVRLARALLAQCMSESEDVAEVQPTDIVGDAVVRAQCVPFIEAQQVSCASLHQRDANVERGAGSSRHNRVEYLAHRLLLERVSFRERAAPPAGGRPRLERMRIVAKIGKQVFARGED